MITLALDTSTGVCCGLSRDSQPIAEIHTDDPQSHVELLAQQVQSILAQHDFTLQEVDRFVVGLGPGPFTGLRVGIVTARTLAWSLGKGVKGVCSLDVIAAHYAEQAPHGDFIVATDARRKELYWARYDDHGTRCEGPHVGKPDVLPNLPIVGPGASMYPDQVVGDIVAEGPNFLDASLMAARCDVLADMGVEPLYLRQPDATVPTTRKSALTSKRLHLPNRVRP